MTGGTGHSHQHKKFYILMSTLIVGAILLLLLVNEDGKFSILTGATTGFGGGERSELAAGSGEGTGVKIKLDFDTVPTVKEETSVKSVRIIFDYLGNKIKINEEELELKDLKDIVMEISNFQGEVDFDGRDISLSGEGEKVKVNGIEISTQGKMEISFSDLVYKKLKLEEVGLELVDFEEGSGELTAGERMRYGLAKERIKMSNFQGNLAVGEGESLMGAEGAVERILVEGEFSLSIS